MRTDVTIPPTAVAMNDQRREGKQGREREIERGGCRGRQGSKNRNAEERDHPRRLDHGQHESRAIERRQGHGAADEQREVLGQELGRESRDDRAREEDGEDESRDTREYLIRQRGGELRETPYVEQHAVEAREDEYSEKERDGAE